VGSKPRPPKLSLTTEALAKVVAYIVAEVVAEIDFRILAIPYGGLLFILGNTSGVI
jgi:hypothetical protein